MQITSKCELRKYIRDVKRQYSNDTLDRMSARIIHNLESMPLFLHAHTVLLYHSLCDEVNTHELLLRHSSSKHLLLPSVIGDYLELHKYTLDSPVKSGSYGIQESHDDLFTEYSTIDLCIVPGMAFDHSGHRLGRGKGYYDRLLPQISCPKIGLCFDFQYFTSIPHESHDISMDYVVH